MPHTDIGLSSGAGAGSSLLDSPPPTPQLESDPARTPTSLADLAGPPSQVPTDQLPEPILRGLVDVGEQMSSVLDSFAQAAPNLSPDVLLVKVALQRLMGKLLTAGAPSLSPTATGTGFPAGGLPGAGPPAP